ncbi:MAG TPA: hypothetical protein VNX86_04805 [Rhizomicrobium sp.]|nr:hypothetical protein [Rhizomicrobium sp.]
MLAALFICSVDARAGVPNPLDVYQIGAGLQKDSTNHVDVTGGGPTGLVSATSSQTLTNAQCNSTVVGYSLGVGTLLLPASPPLGCTFTIEPFFDTINLGMNGNTLLIPGYGSATIDWITLPVPSVGHTRSASYLVGWNGTNWWVLASNPRSLEALIPLSDPVLAHGQVRFDYNSVFELCPYNGLGINVTGRMHQIPTTCLTTSASNTTSSALNYFYVQQDLDEPVTGAANNGSGLVRLTVANSANAGDACIIWTHSINGTTEADVSAQPCAVVDSTHVDLTGVSFVHTFTTSPNADARVIDHLEPNTTGWTWLNGIAMKSGSSTETLVGMAYIGASHAVNDSATKRDVAGWFNRKPKTCKNVYTALRSTTSTSYAEPNAEIECEFVTWADSGDLKWALSGCANNTSNADGWNVSAGFDSTTTAETENAAGLNPPGSAGQLMPLTVDGAKSGLSEGKHYITLLAEAITGGTAQLCGNSPGVTSLEVSIPQ